MLDLAGADADREGAERAVGGRVAVAAHDGEPGLGEALLGPDDVDDALAGRAHRVEADPELGAVRRQYLHLLGRDRIGDRLVDVHRRHVVIHGGDGEVGTADGAPGEADAVERLRRRDLVDQVEVDVEEVGLAVAPMDDVALPHLVAEGGGRGSGHHPILPGACFTARMTSPGLRTGTAAGRWVIAAAVLGSGVSFLDGTVVNAALPAIARDLHADLGDLQWILTGYLLTLASLLVLGGSLGDRYGRRRIFMIGLGAFAATSLVCSIAPDIGSLIAARCVQGMAAALVVPNSLAIVSASFHPTDRARAIGAWSGFGGVATAIGPFLGGWLIDSVSWRLVFVINLPIAAAAMWIAARHVPESRDEHAAAHLDVLGSVALTVGLGGLVYALIEGPGNGWPTLATVLGVVGVVALLAFVALEARRPNAMVPLSIFRSQQFSGANAVTFAVYAALGTVTFLLVVYLQTDARVLRAGGGRVVAADHRLHAAVLGPGGRARATHRSAPAR